MSDRHISLSEIFILIFLIIINFLDFFEVLPGDVDFAKKLLSWFLLAYLLYRISLTELFFGTRNKIIDFLLIVSYFLLITKNLVGYAHVSVEEANFLAPIYHFLIHNNIMVEITSFYIGGIGLILLSFVMTFLMEVKSPSLMDVIHEQGYPQSFSKMIERFIATFFVLTFFFIVVFNLVMEWLAIAVDASLLVVAFFFYMFTLFRTHFRNLHPESFLYKVGDVGEEFYEKFIGLFHSRQRIFLGISGLLVLHLLTDVANFIFPYIFGFHDILYFGQLGSSTHNPLFKLFLIDASVATSLISKMYTSWVYIFNIFAMLFLLILPAYIWYKLYHRSGFFVSSRKLSIFFISVMIFILAPVFKLIEMKVKGLTGVDIITINLDPNLNLALIVLSTILFGIFIYFLSHNHFIKEKIMGLGIVLIDIFFAIYIFLFFKSTSVYYLNTIKLLLQRNEYFVTFYFIVFFIITTLFYIIGFLIFLSETKKEFRYIQ
ncbi:MAG: hypothetical protein ABIC04_08330 [Nanoarchaeota archaeon]